MRLSSESIILQRYTRMSGQGTFAKLIKPNENCLLPPIHLNWKRCICKGYAQFTNLYGCTRQKSTWQIIPHTGDRVQKYTVLKLAENMSLLFHCKLSLKCKYDEPLFRSGTQYMRKKMIYNCTRFIGLHLNWPDWNTKQLKKCKLGWYPGYALSGVILFTCHKESLSYQASRAFEPNALVCYLCIFSQ